MCLRLERVVLGQDEDGDEISSCVVVPVITEDEEIPQILIDDMEPAVMEILRQHNGVSQRELIKMLRKQKHQIGDTRLKKLLEGLRRHGRIDDKNRCL